MSPPGRELRTDHSVLEVELAFVFRELRGRLTEDSVFVDLGCHYGYVSFAVAKRFGCFVLAVDNFVGTTGDEWMARTIEARSGSRGFFRDVARESEEDKMSVAPIHCDVFWTLKDHGLGGIDAVFVDSSHLEEDLWHFFDKCFEMLKPGGQFMGHDYSKSSKTPWPWIRRHVDALCAPGKPKVEGTVFSYTKPGSD